MGWPLGAFDGEKPHNQAHKPQTPQKPRHTPTLWPLGAFDGEKPHNQAHKPQTPQKPRHTPTLWPLVLLLSPVNVPPASEPAHLTQPTKLNLPNPTQPNPPNPTH